MEENKQTTVLYHLGADWNQKISTRIDRALTSYINGDLSNWFFNLKAIKFLIVSYLKDTEKENLRNKENIITGMLRDQKKPAHQIEEYDILIKELLSSKGFLNPLKDDMSNIYGQG